MANVEDIKIELASIQLVVSNVAGDVDSLIAQVAALKEQLNNGGVATQADLDTIAGLAQAVKESLAAIDDKEPPSGSP